MKFGNHLPKPLVKTNSSKSVPPISTAQVACFVLLDPPATVPYCGLPNVRSLVLECVPQGEKRIFWGVRNPGALEWLVRVILVVDEEWFLMAFFGL